MREIVNISIESRSNKGVSHYWYKGFPYSAEMKAIKKRIGGIKSWPKQEDTSHDK